MTSVLPASTNPIEWLERRYQQRSTPSVMRRWSILGPATLLVVLSVIALTLLRVDSAAREFVVATVWFAQGLVVVRCIAAGANVISREHMSQTWDTLVLTGISARQILLGKWFAVLRQVAPWMVGLATLRLFMLPIFMMASLNRYAWYIIAHAGTSRAQFYSGFTVVGWVPSAAGVAVVGTLALTALEILCCTAIGLAASALMRRGWTALVVGIGFRFTPVLLFAAFTTYEVGWSLSWRVMRYPPMAMADGGSAPLFQLVQPLTLFTLDNHSTALYGLAAVGIMLTGMIVVSLMAAWWAICNAGALPHPDTQPA